MLYLEGGRGQEDKTRELRVYGREREGTQLLFFLYYFICSCRSCVGRGPLGLWTVAGGCIFLVS